LWSCVECSTGADKCIEYARLMVQMHQQGVLPSFPANSSSVVRELLEQALLRAGSRTTEHGDAYSSQLLRHFGLSNGSSRPSASLR
jgi:hypothetical protein